MANEELGKLSPEQIQKLAGTISEAKNLTGQQEEIIKRVIAGETDIGKLRIASLEKYFDIYSRNLDLVARKHSALNDAFLILDKKLAENYRALSSDITKLEQQLTDIAKNAGSTRSLDQPPEGSDNSTEGKEASPKTPDAINAAIQALTDTFKQESEARAREVASGNSTLLELEKQYQEQRFAQLSQHLDQLAQASKASFSQFATPTNPNLSGTGASSAEKQPTEAPTAESQVTEIKATNEGKSPTGVESGDAVQQKVSDEKKAELNSLENDEGEGDSDVSKKLDAWKLFFQKTEEERREAIAKGSELIELDQEKVKQKYQEIHLKTLEEQEKQVKKIEDQMLALEVARMQKELGLVDQINQVRLDSQLKAINAEVEALTALNKLEVSLTASEKHAGELGANRAREIGAQDSLAETKKREEQIAKFRAQRELYYKQKNNGILEADDAKRIEKELADQFKHQKKNEENLSKERARLSKIEYQNMLAESREAVLEQSETLLGKGHTIAERQQALYSMTHDQNGNFSAAGALASATTVIANLAEKLNDSIDKIASYKGDIDTRLQGSNNEKFAGSYWDQLTKDMMSVGSVTPFFKQEDFAENIKSLVNQGIAFDLKQRAFLMTIQEKIANTFEVADGTLLRLVRIQQEDSTAGRLGMESALNSFLNEMYENTEYLKTVADGVRTSLEEMEALMDGAAATEVEYQVQKWMGSLYSVGMSDSAVQSISTALGQIASGQVDALTNGGAGNLLVMAANNANIPIAEILAEGLDAEKTNSLLQATVNYLAEIAKNSNGNNVVQQQLAGVFGIKASDIRAATNLQSAKDENKYSIKNIFDESLTYSNMLDQLNAMAGSMAKRTSLGEMLSNIWANGQYSIAGGIASTPAAYLLYKMSNLLKDTTGGIDFGLPLIMGNGLPITFNVADLMRVGAVGTGILGSLGPMISGLGSSFSGRSMLSKMGIESGTKLQITPRGGDGLGAVIEEPAQTTSGSGYVGNSSGSDIKNSTIQSTEDDAKQQVIEAQEEAEATQIDFINVNLLKMCELLDDVANGKRSLSVKVAGYGLTNINSDTALSSAQGGVGGLLSNNTNSSELSSGFDVSGNSTSTSNSYKLNSNMGLGGWSMK